LKFDDENFELRHERKGMLSMVNFGPNINGSQFFITTTEAHHLDGKCVVFGRVIKRLGVIRSIERVDVEPDGQPTIDIDILSLKIVEKFSLAMKSVYQLFLRC